MSDTTNARNANLTPLRAILWCAVSSEAQAEDEKVSLPKQESDQRALCAREGWQIVDVLRVKHSRDYIDIYELADDVRATGSDAVDRLMEHWRRRDFDVLVCRDAERFGRTQSLNAYVVEKTMVECGALIYSLSDGMIDRPRMRMFITMTGYKAAADLERMVNGRKAAMLKNAQNGISTTSGLPISHKVVRNEKGRNIGTAVDTQHLPAIVQAARLVVERGVTWQSLEQVLHDEFGLGEKGRAYTRFKFYELFYNLVFWGNNGVYWNMTPDGRVRPKGAWAFDASAAPPDGAVLFHNTHPAALTGPLAEQLKAELRRRLQYSGRRDYKRSRPFSGLIYCETCLFAMPYHGNKGYPGYKCVSRYAQNTHRLDCDNRKFISERLLRPWFTVLIERLLSSPDAADDIWGLESPVAALEKAERQMADLVERIRKTIEAQAAAPQALASMYADQIQQYGRQYDAVKADVTKLQRRADDTSAVARAAALREIERYGLDNLWEQPGHEINQQLHRIMGDLRVFVRDGNIVRIGPYPERKARP